MYRVVVVEDNEIDRLGYECAFARMDKYLLVNSYDRCESALKNLLSDAPDLVIMDLEFPGMSGVEAIKRIKHLKPYTIILVSSSHSNYKEISEALQAGAMGYLAKNETTLVEELENTIRVLTEGKAFLSETVLLKLVQSFHRNRNSPLTKRESEVLALFCSGFSYTAIGEKLFLSKNTIRTHLRNIYEKLEVTKKSEVAEKATRERLI